MLTPTIKNSLSFLSEIEKCECVIWNGLGCKALGQSKCLFFRYLGAVYIGSSVPLKY